MPGEVGNIVLPKISGIDADLKQRLLEYVDDVVRKNQDIENALDIVDKELLIGFLGIEQKKCNKCREIWKKLQGRRLKRM